MSTIDPVDAAPETRNVSFLALLYGCTAAPLFWTGQLMLGFSVSAHACFPGDHPVSLASTGSLSTAIVVFDAVVLLACASGGLMSWTAWRRVRQPGGHRHTLHTGEGRNRFLAMWGMLSSLWFFGAVLFNTIASLVVPPCTF